MHLIVTCPGGAQHALHADERTTVADVKALVAQREGALRCVPSPPPPPASTGRRAQRRAAPRAGTPPGQQALLFAGRQLAPDDAVLLPDLRLADYNLGGALVVYLQPRLAAPVRIFLTRRAGDPAAAAPRQAWPELVEAASTLGNVARLLAVRGLSAGDFPAEVVVVKRADGSGCPRVCVRLGDSVQRLLDAIWQAEVRARDLSCWHATAARLRSASTGQADARRLAPTHASVRLRAQGVAVASVTFCQQAGDGCLQATFAGLPPAPGSS